MRNSSEVILETFREEQRVIDPTAPEYLPFAQNLFFPSFDIQNLKMLNRPIPSKHFAFSFTPRIYGYETWSEGI